MTNQPNVSWPGWEVVRLIGRGSFGAVYEIRRSLFGEEESAALKVISIPPDQSDVDELYGAGFDDDGITATFQSHMKSVLAEYSLMRKMNGHSNIVNCDDVSCIQHEDGFGWDIYIKMELLTPLLKSLPAGSVPEETVVKVAHDLCQALVLCKKHDIVHRDIKPQNIFVSPNGDYKLGDFGIAKTVEKTTGGTKVGTYRYMAPEVYNNQPYGSGADIYSLGLVLYQLLNERRLPFMPLPPEMPRAGQDEAARERRLAGEAIPAPVHGSEALKAIVLKACAYDPKERFASAEEMLAAVDEVKRRATVQPSPVVKAEPKLWPTPTPSAAPKAELAQQGFKGVSLPAPAESQDKKKTFVTIRFIDEGRVVHVTNYHIGERIVVPKLANEIKRDGTWLRFVAWEPMPAERAFVDAEYTAVYEDTSSGKRIPQIKPKQSVADGAPVALPAEPQGKEKTFVTIRFLDEGRVVHVTNYHIGERIVVPKLANEIKRDGTWLRFVAWEPMPAERAFVDAEYTAVYGRISSEENTKSVGKKNKWKYR